MPPGLPTQKPQSSCHKLQSLDKSRYTHEKEMINVRVRIFSILFIRSHSQTFCLHAANNTALKKRPPLDTLSMRISRARRAMSRKG